MSLFFVNCERTVLFSVKRDLDPPFTTLMQRTNLKLFPLKLADAVTQLDQIRGYCQRQIQNFL